MTDDDPRRRLHRGWRADSRRKPEGWRRQEAKTIQASGRPQKGSGATRGAGRKGDETGELFLVSKKTTEKKALQLDRDWLEEIARQAGNVRLRAALMFGFDALGGLGTGRIDWVAFEEDTAKTLIGVVEAVLAGDLERAEALAELIRGR